MALLADILTKNEKTIHDKAFGAFQQATQVAKEAKALAADAIEDGVYAARRTMTRTQHDLEDLRDAASLRIRRAPLTTVAAALGMGVLLGAACVWAARACGRREA